MMNLGSSGSPRAHTHSWLLDVAGLFALSSRAVAHQNTSVSPEHQDERDASLSDLDRHQTRVTDIEAQIARREDLVLRRENMVALRERAVEQREFLTGQRAATEGEQIADLFDRLADSRHKMVDRKEHAMEQISSVDQSVRELRQRTRHVIQRSQAALAASTERMKRSNAALNRMVLDLNGQANAGRAVATDQRTPAQTTAPPADHALSASPPLTNDPDSTIPGLERLTALREQLAEAARGLAATELKVALTHQRIAVRHPASAIVAEQAHAAARRATQIADHYSPPHPTAPLGM